MNVSELVATFLPHLARISVEHVHRSGRTIRIQATTGTTRASCTACGQVSRQVHSRYHRRLSDTAIGGQEILIHLQVTRFACRNPGCASKTFAEQVPGS